MNFQGHQDIVNILIMPFNHWQEPDKMYLLKYTTDF